MHGRLSLRRLWSQVSAADFCGSATVGYLSTRKTRQIAIIASAVKGMRRPSYIEGLNLACALEEVMQGAWGPYIRDVQPVPLGAFEGLGLDLSPGSDRPPVV